jgi:hypothetical protein
MGINSSCRKRKLASRFLMCNLGRSLTLKISENLLISNCKILNGQHGLRQGDRHLRSQSPSSSLQGKKKQRRKKFLALFFLMVIPRGLEPLLPT